LSKELELIKLLIDALGFEIKEEVEYGGDEAIISYSPDGGIITHKPYKKVTTTLIPKIECEHVVYTNNTQPT